MSESLFTSYNILNIFLKTILSYKNKFTKKSQFQKPQSISLYISFQFEQKIFDKFKIE